MDLRLGLSLSGSSASTSSDNISIDLNVEDDDQDQKIEILGSAKKRCFEEVFDESINSDHQTPSPKTLPLLLRWNNNNNNDDDDDNLEQEMNIDVIINQEEYLETENSSSVVEYYGGGGVVGWPPTNSWRRSRRKTDTTGKQSGGVGVAAVENRGVLINGHRRKNNSDSVMFVKVKMEGVGIARKVDLLLHHSSHTLLQTLLTMFGKCQESIHDYKLLFQDKEGFWHSSEDIPWGNLIQSVNRLQLLRKRY